MKFLLRDNNPALTDAWREQLAQAPDVEVSCGDVFDVTADAIVSPANSFGFMDGGILGGHPKPATEGHLKTGHHR